MVLGYASEILLPTRHFKTRMFNWDSMGAVFSLEIAGLILLNIAAGVPNGTPAGPRFKSNQNTNDRQPKRKGHCTMASSNSNAVHRLSLLDNDTSTSTNSTSSSNSSEEGYSPSRRRRNLRTILTVDSSHPDDESESDMDFIATPSTTPAAIAVDKYSQIRFGRMDDRIRYQQNPMVRQLSASSEEEEEDLSDSSSTEEDPPPASSSPLRLSWWTGRTSSPRKESSSSSSSELCSSSNPGGSQSTTTTNGNDNAAAAEAENTLAADDSPSRLAAFLQDCLPQDVEESANDNSNHPNNNIITMSDSDDNNDMGTTRTTLDVPSLGNAATDAAAAAGPTVIHLIPPSTAPHSPDTDADRHAQSMFRSNAVDLALAESKIYLQRVALLEAQAEDWKDQVAQAKLRQHLAEEALANHDNDSDSEHLQIQHARALAQVQQEHALQMADWQAQLAAAQSENRQRQDEQQTAFATLERQLELSQQALQEQHALHLAEAQETQQTHADQVATLERQLAAAQQQSQQALQQLEAQHALHLEAQLTEARNEQTEEQEKQAKEQAAMVAQMQEQHAEKLVQLESTARDNEKEQEEALQTLEAQHASVVADLRTQHAVAKEQSQQQHEQLVAAQQTELRTATQEHASIVAGLEAQFRQACAAQTQSATKLAQLEQEHATLVADLREQTNQDQRQTAQEHQEQLDHLAREQAVVVENLQVQLQEALESRLEQEADEHRAVLKERLEEKETAHKNQLAEQESHHQSELEQHREDTEQVQNKLQEQLQQAADRVEQLQVLVHKQEQAKETLQQRHEADLESQRSIWEEKIRVAHEATAELQAQLDAMEEATPDDHDANDSPVSEQHERTFYKVLRQVEARYQQELQEMAGRVGIPNHQLNLRLSNLSDDVALIAESVDFSGTDTNNDRCDVNNGENPEEEITRVPSRSTDGTETHTTPVRSSDRSVDRIIGDVTLSDNHPGATTPEYELMEEARDAVSMIPELERLPLDLDQHASSASSFGGGRSETLSSLAGITHLFSLSPETTDGPIASQVAPRTRNSGPSDGEELESKLASSLDRVEALESEKARLEWSLELVKSENQRLQDELEQTAADRLPPSDGGALPEESSSVDNRVEQLEAQQTQLEQEREVVLQRQSESQESLDKVTAERDQALADLERVQSEYAEVLQRQMELEQSLSSVKQKLSDMEGLQEELNRAQQTISVMEAESEVHQQDMADVSARRDRIIERLRVAEEEKSDLIEKQGSLQLEIDNCRKIVDLGASETEVLKIEMQEIIASRDLAEENFSSSEKEKNELVKKLSTSESERESSVKEKEALHSQVTTALSDISNLQEQLNTRTTEFESALTLSETLKTETSSLQKQLDEVSKRRDADVQSLADADERTKILETKNQALSAKISSSETALSQTEHLLQENTRKLYESESRIKDLESAVHNGSSLSLEIERLKSEVSRIQEESDGKADLLESETMESNQLRLAIAQLEEDLKATTLELDTLQTNYLQSNDQVAEYTGMHQEALVSLKLSQESCQAAEHLLSDTEKQLFQTRSDLQVQTDACVTLRVQLEEKENQCAAGEERLQILEGSLSELKSELRVRSDAEESLRNELKQKAALCAGENQHKNDAERRLAETQLALDSANEQMKEERAKFLFELKTVKEELILSEEERKSTSLRIVELQQELESNKVMLDARDGAINGFKRDLEQYRAIIKHQEGQIVRVTDLHGQLQVATQKCQQLQADLQTNEAELANLEEECQSAKTNCERLKKYAIKAEGKFEQWWDYYHKNADIVDAMKRSKKGLRAKVAALEAQLRSRDQERALWDVKQSRLVQLEQEWGELESELYPEAS